MFWHIGHWAAPLEQLRFQCLAQRHHSGGNEGGACPRFHFPSHPPSSILSGELNRHKFIKPPMRKKITKQFFQFVHQLWSYFDSPGLTLYLLLHMCNPQLYRVANEQGTSSLYRKREKGNSSNPRSDINVIYCKSARISPWLVTIYYSQTNLSPLWSQGSKLSSFVKGVGAFPCALMSFSWPLPKWQYLLLLLFV